MVGNRFPTKVYSIPNPCESYKKYVIPIRFCVLNLLTKNNKSSWWDYLINAYSWHTKPISWVKNCSRRYKQCKPALVFNSVAKPKALRWSTSPWGVKMVSFTTRMHAVVQLYNSKRGSTLRKFSACEDLLGYHSLKSNNVMWQQMGR